MTIPKGARVAVKVSNETAGMAFADLLTREVIPQRGSVTVNGHALNDLHQSVVAAKIGYAHSKPYLFDGTLGDNLLLPFKKTPLPESLTAKEFANWQSEAGRSGNSTDPFTGDWVDPKLAGFNTDDDIREWWFQLVEAMGIDGFMVHRALTNRLDVVAQADLLQEIVNLRPEIARRLKEAGLDDIVHRYHPDKFNPVSPLGSNLLYALPTELLQQTTLASEENFVQILRDEGIVHETAEMSATVVENLMATFGKEDTDHPLFRMLNMDEDLYHQLADIATRRRELGEDALSQYEFGLLLTVPFAFSAEQIGPALSEEYKQNVLQIRKANGPKMLKRLDGLFEAIDENKYIPVMTLMGNAIFGRISNMAGARAEKVEAVVAEVLREHGLRRRVAQSIYDLQTGLGGANLPAVFRERAALSRAGIKKPDILIMENALMSHDAESRVRTRERISALLPDATKIFIETHFNAPELYDMFVEIKNGRIDGETTPQPVDEGANKDLNRKLRAISEAELFAKLDTKNQRLLAFSARWYKADAGQIIFQKDQRADAAYLCIEGKAGLYWDGSDENDGLIAEIEPGRLIGDLAIIMEETRPLNLKAIEPSLFLRIGAEEFRAVIETDAAVAVSLLKSVAGHLTNTANALREEIASHAEQTSQ